MSGEFAGSLRERITIERRSGGRDMRAGATGAYLYDGAAWAAVAPLMPSSLIAGDAISALPRWKVTMRKREGIGPSTRIVWRGRFLAVRAVESDPATPAQMILTTDEVR
jgi:head-tail adaptor